MIADHVSRAMARAHLKSMIEQGRVYQSGVIAEAVSLARPQICREGAIWAVFEAFKAMEVCDHYGWSRDAI